MIATRPSVRDQIAEIEAEIRDTDLSPLRAAKLQLHLTSLLSNVLVELTDAEHAYNQVLLRCYETEEKANRAEIRAAASSEHLRRAEAKALEKWIGQTIASLKYLQRATEEEMRLAR